MLFLKAAFPDSDSESRLVVSDSLQSHQLYSPWNSPGQNTGVGFCSLLWGIFPTQGSNPHLLHWQVDSLPLSHLGSPSCALLTQIPALSGLVPNASQSEPQVPIQWG